MRGHSTSAGAILSYLELRPGNFYRVEADVDGMQFVTARGWEDLSNLMAVYEKLRFLVDEQVIREYIHHADVAEDVAAYLISTANIRMTTAFRRFWTAASDRRSTRASMRRRFDEAARWYTCCWTVWRRFQQGSV